MTKSVSPTKQDTSNEDNQELDVKNYSEESSSSENQDVNAEESSNSGKSESKKTVLDAVNAALNQGEEDDEDSDEQKPDEKDAAKPVKKEGASEKEEGSSDDEATEDEKKAMIPKTRKRFEQLQNKFREEKETRIKVEKERDEFKNDATYYRQFRSFLKENDLSHEEANTLFDIGALMKTDPMKALAAITPYYNQLLEVTGNVLPADLQESVKLGYITEKHALDLSRARASSQNLAHRNNVTQEKYQRKEAVQHRQQQTSHIQSAIASLEKGWESSDPDYKVKSTRILERIKLRLLEAERNGSLPKTPEEAVKVAQTAKKEIDSEMSSFLVKKKPINAIDGGSAGNPKPKPKNTLDVINQVLGG